MVVEEVVEATFTHHPEEVGGGEKEKGMTDQLE